MKKFLLTFLFVFISFYVQSQTLKEANKLYDNFAYTEASVKFDEYLNEQENPSAEILRKAGNSYYYLDEPYKALPYFKKLYAALGSNISDQYYLRYIQCLRQVRDYEEAEKHTKRYYQRKNDPQAIEQYMQQKKYMDSLSKQQSLYTTRNLAINTEYAEFGGAFYGSQLVYSSSKKNSGFEKKYAWNDQPFLNLYVADRNGSNGMLSNERLFLPDALPSKYHDATLCFSSSLDTIYYTSNITKKKRRLINNEKGTNNFQIIRATLNDEGELVDKTPLFFNSKDYAVGHPALSSDGKYLFFASDMPEGQGETDLYVVELFVDGSMNTPKNLGDQINTEGREMFPYVQGNTLYFASDGHYGLGGLDVFKVEFTEDLKFSSPKNLAKPVNSNRDDFAFIIDSTASQGYFSSNRLNGKGDDDLYYFTKSTPECYQYIQGKAIDSTTQKPLNQVLITAYNQFDDKITETKTDTTGSYRLQLSCDKTFKLTATKEGYSKETHKIDTHKKHKDTITGVDFALVNYQDLIEKEGDQEKISINPIYFEYDKATITQESATELDKVVYAMQKFPNMIIKIESHTDARGSDAYNLSLSQKRAESTEAYIITKGIDPERILSTKGFGETRLKNKCRNGVKCTEQEHELNRRSNFIVVEK